MCNSSMATSPWGPGEGLNQATVPSPATTDASQVNVSPLIVVVAVKSVWSNGSLLSGLMGNSATPLARVVSIAVGSQDPTHVGGGTDLHDIGERAGVGTVSVCFDRRPRRLGSTIVGGKRVFQWLSAVKVIP